VVEAAAARLVRSPVRSREGWGLNLRLPGWLSAF
jgi:hypothetical protein